MDIGLATVGFHLIYQKPSSEYPSDVKLRATTATNDLLELLPYIGININLFPYTMLRVIGALLHTQMSRFFTGDRPDVVLNLI